MNKKFIWIIIAVFLPTILSSLVALPFSGDADYDYIVDENFEITNLDVEVDAKADRYVYMKETITVNYINARSSLYRELPVNNGLEIRDIYVEGREFSVESESGFLVVDMDSTNFTPSRGEKTYIISYTMITPKIKGAADSIALNVIGQGWRAPILSATVHITLPEAPAYASYYAGARNVTTGLERLNITSNGNKITIQTNDTLEAFEGVTVGYDMPEGTMNTKFDTGIIVYIAVAVILLASCALIFFKIGRDDTIYPVINFIPPEGITPADAGLLVDGNCTPTDLTSLIFYWASQKHLVIIDDDKGGNITLQKLKGLDSSHKRYEHTIFNGLFKGKEDVVEINSLKNTFYTVITNASNEIKAEYKGKLYQKISKTMSIVVSILAVLFVGISVFASGLGISSAYTNSSGFIAVIAAAVIYAVGTLLLRYEPKIMEKKNLYYALYSVMVFVICFIIAYFLKNALVPKTLAIVLAVTFGLIMSFAPFVQSRTEYYNKQLNELMGFRKFIKEAEKEKLEMLLKENPQYYYDILPYANVLGVSKEWMDKFKSLTIEPPTWYRSRNTLFNYLIFNSMFTRSMATITATAVSRPAPSKSGISGGGFGGGFGGGGGFSGGGFGGGGGGSR